MAFASLFVKAAEPSDRGLSRRFLTDFLDFRFVRRPDLLAWSEKLLVRGSGNRAPHFHRGVAQLAERWSPKPEVASSIPAAPADRPENLNEITTRSGKAKTQGNYENRLYSSGQYW